MSTMLLDITRLQELFLRIKVEHEQTFSRTPSFDTLIHDLLEGDHGLDKYEEYFLHSLTERQLKSLFINHVLH